MHHEKSNRHRWTFFQNKGPGEFKGMVCRHLGFQTDQYGAVFDWRKQNGEKGFTVWSTFKEDTKYFEPGDKQFMFNYRVENLEELLKVLKEEGVKIVGEMEVFEYGKFGWVMDPEGNKIELWEPVDTEFEKMGPSNPSN